jgi:hypothetical protein
MRRRKGSHCASSALAVAAQSGQEKKLAKNDLRVNAIAVSFRLCAI